MAVPDAANPTPELSMLKIARERKGYGYTANTAITSPIHFSDLSRLTGGNTSGSGESYPAINTLNSILNRPDGDVPEKFSEFLGYDQNVSRSAFQYQEGLDANDACTLGLPSGDEYYHTDTNNLYPDALDGSYTAYTTETGSTVVSAGYYQVFDTSGNSTNKYIQVGSNGSIIGGGTC
jgi:hypothetical protein